MKDLNDNEISTGGMLLRILQILISIGVLGVAAYYGLIAFCCTFIALFSVALYHCVFLTINPNNVKPKISLDPKVEQDLDDELHDMLEKSKSIVKENTCANQNAIGSIKQKDISKDETIEHSQELANEEIFINQHFQEKEGPALTRRKY